MKTKQKRDICYLCLKPITQSKAFGYNKNGFYHPNCLDSCDDCELPFTSRVADYCKGCKNKEVKDETT